MDVAPTWPVFLLDGGDVSVYENPEALQQGVEWWMSAQPVVLLDCHGRPMRLITRGRRTIGVELTGDSPMPDRLRRTLAGYLAAMKAPPIHDDDLMAYARAVASIIERSER